MIPRRRMVKSACAMGIGVSLSGCVGLLGGNEEDIKDTDGDGVIDSEDYAPRDPDVQERSDVQNQQQQSSQQTQTSTEQEPSPSVDLSFMEDIQGDRNQVSGRVQLNGAQEVIIRHDGTEIGTFNSNGHKVFHQLDEQPAVKSGEMVQIFARWDGTTHKLGEEPVVGV